MISGEKLYLKMWFIPNGSRDIKDIVSVKRSYNPLSSPAGSLKRLNIHFASGSTFWLISPVREKGFVEALRAINPKIEVYILETSCLLLVILLQVLFYIPSQAHAGLYM